MDARRSAPSVGWVVCPNGFGHLVRSAAIVTELLRVSDPAPRVTMAVSGRQLAALSGDGPVGRLADAGVAFVTGIVDGAETWSTDPAAYRRPGAPDLGAWVDRWAAEPSLAGADLVVSDNLVGVLGPRPDAVLVGSFLWSDVLEAHASGDDPVAPTIAAFVAADRALLAATRPPMLATADIVHPGVLERTAAVPLGWMRDPEPAAGGGGAAVLGGRTGGADRLLAGVVAALVAAGLPVATDLAKAPPGARPFDHSAGAWAAIDVLVCRPGLGAVTQAVAQRTPMVVVHEAGNAELSHVAGRLAALGLAVDLGAAPDPAAAVTAVGDLLAGPARAVMVERLAARPTGGHREAAAWLADRLAEGGRA